MDSRFTPLKSHKFAFGVWTVMNRGRDPFGEETREPLSALDAVRGLGQRGAWGFEFHDNDLVPMGATLKERDRIVKSVKKAMAQSDIKAVTGTTNLFFPRVFKDGAFTSNNAEVRAFAIQKTMKGIDLAAELGAGIYVFWGGREGAEADASKDPVQAVKRFREAMNFLCEYVKSQKYEIKFSIEPKPNEPRGDIYLPTAGHALAFIATLDHPAMVGVNPEVAHVKMAGLNPYHETAQVLEAGKLFDIHLNGQKPNRYDQDLRFGSDNIKEAFFLVKLLEENDYQGPKAFDAHAFRTEDIQGVWDGFVTGSMVSYLMLRDKVGVFNSDPLIQELLAGIEVGNKELEKLTRRFSKANARSLLDRKFDPEKLSQSRLRYEELDQRLTEILLGC